VACALGNEIKPLYFRKSRQLPFRHCLSYLVHSQSEEMALLKLGEVIKVASTIVPCFIFIPLALS
jgi:hypothetical protein